MRKQRRRNIHEEDDTTYMGQHSGSSGLCRDTWEYEGKDMHETYTYDNDDEDSELESIASLHIAGQQQQHIT